MTSFHCTRRLDPLGCVLIAGHFFLSIMQSVIIVRGGLCRHCCVPSTCNTEPLLYDKVHRTTRCINSPFGPWPALLDVTSDKTAIETSFSWQQQIPNKCWPIEPTFLVNSAVISVPEPETCLWAPVAVALSVRRCYVHRWSQRQVSHPQTSVTALRNFFFLKKAATKSIHSI